MDKAVETVVATFGRIDAVINNAGVIAVALYENTTKSDFQTSIDVHFWATYNMIEATLPYLRNSQKARIINISSIGGKIPVPHLSSYCTGKYALMGYSKTLRAELMKENIFVTTVSPGLMRTGSQGHAEFRGQSEKEYQWFTIGGSLPILTIGAERAAKKIIGASEKGRAEITLTLPAKLAVRMDALTPELFSDLMSIANVALPFGNGSTEKVTGQEAHSFIAPSIITKLSKDAAKRNNEKSL